MQFKHVCLDQKHMATTFSLLISTSEARVSHAERTLEECHALIAKLENDLSEFRESTPVYRFNERKSGTRIDAPESLLDLLKLSRNIERRTEGVFSCFAKSESKEEFSKLIELDVEQACIHKLIEGAHLSFGGIGKGYALDRVRAIIEREGFTDYVLNAGGSSLWISGFSSPGVPWDWAWSWRKDSASQYQGQVFYHHSGVPTAIGVSGILEQGVHHIERSSGETIAPALTALVAHPSCAEADALSTALFLSGWEKGISILESPLQTPGIAVIDKEEKCTWNGIFQELWGNVSSRIASIFIFLSLFLHDISISFANEDEAIDLTDLGMDSFNPYLYDRNNLWILLPVLILLAVVIHLPLPFRKKIRPKRSSGGR